MKSFTFTDRGMATFLYKKGFTNLTIEEPTNQQEDPLSNFPSFTFTIEDTEMKYFNRCTNQFRKGEK